ncbi:hypothetical protein MAL08_15825 [Leptospira noguchii]|uniref:hypothetical protein n=1 Tax=Leptospira noguchii TaxID=28182 RepID=UPI001FB67929|nr:hypothetical protein [Leptospira noguchii]UOG37491.1 hypothetical protein MAL08_15825 [Leptospira noguchii]
MERKELNETLFTKAFETRTTLSYGSAFRESLHLSLLFAPIFLRRTHVKFKFIKISNQNSFYKILKNIGSFKSDRKFFRILSTRLSIN